MINSLVARHLRSLLALLVAITVVTPAVQGQFSGPALGGNTEVNVPREITTDPAILFPSDREVRLEAGDLLAIRLYGSTDYSYVVRVSMDGSIDLPLAGALHVRGLSVHQAERLIADRLVAGHMYVDPQISIQITEAPNQVITIAGEVHGTFPALGRRRLFDIIALGGGLPLAASHIITIQRPGVDKPINVDLGNDPVKSSLANIPVFPGDTIIVSRVGVVYALGAFRSQNAFPITGNSPLTLLQTMSLAGGPNFEGKREDARVLRTIGTKRIEVKVNLKRIMAGKDPDLTLQADDIVYLPSSAFKAAIRAGGLATLIGIAGVSSVYIRN